MSDETELSADDIVEQKAVRLAKRDRLNAEGVMGYPLTGHTVLPTSAGRQINTK
jgi:hypothetical protein